ncbi:hypothetical protein [Amphibacillus xylanus]|uniref:Uncharacterized protein n=1 Tax=Amphibacillus xylanus (strain ATCC 51415 / DSM 6626 / JCM 7361 / LMG 17667 / NBRC 15112 / Ep01) TaxID=698758 RepID=K0IVG7_AMPXN|nr:hypothetical protein [Amphibacillus xylanus]BAM46449.1 hypothetical protein AXY_03170 [Amphibacillus xylanus NBRC 15112]
MNLSEREQYIIDRYQAGEAEMILVFVQWCHNHKLDPLVVYREAYPNQALPTKLIEINQELIESNENVQIETSLLLEILQVYGNDDLAFIVANYAEKLIDKTKKG